MISYNVKGKFADAYEVKRYVDSGTYYFEPKKGTNIRKLIVNDIMSIECDDPELQIEMYKGIIILFPFDPNLVPGCEVKCHFDIDMKLEIRVESIDHIDLGGNQCYTLYLNIHKIGHGLNYEN